MLYGTFQSRILPSFLFKKKLQDKFVPENIL